MNFKLLNLFILIVLKYCSTPINAQSFRGLYVERNNNIWVSGNNGIVLKSSKKPNQWDTISPSSHYKTKDFRDIHVVNDSTVIIMSAGDSGVILRTENYGKDWTEVLIDNRKGIFFDVIEIDNKTGMGILLGDALKYGLDYTGDSVSYLVGYFTLDHGKSWNPLKNGAWNQASSRLDALFAASGSSCVILNSRINKINKSARIDFCFAGGGEKGTEVRLVTFELNDFFIISEMSTFTTLPLPIGDGWGIYSLTKINKKSVFLVGGNWKEPYSNKSSGFEIKINFKKKQIFAIDTISNFRGYFSGSAVKNSLLIGVGTSGIGIWNGTAMKTHPIPNLNVCKFSDDYLWYAGSKGVIGKIKISDLSRL
jgi:hypothetical protein